MNTESDVIVVGAGHNALTCPAYLAEAGLTVTVLEGRGVIGGNTVSEELTLPGWRHDSCSSAPVVIQSNPMISQDELELIKKYGLRYLVTDPAVILPIKDDDALIIHPDVERTATNFERFSIHDAQALREMMRDWDAGLKVAHAHFQAGLALADNECPTHYHELRAKSAWEVIMSTFEHPVIRRAIMWMGFATIQPPERPGTGTLPAAIIAGRLKFGWTTPIGGSSALPDALAAHVRDHGGEVITSAWVESFIVEDGRCVGVVTSDGRTFRAMKAVVTGSHLRALPQALPVESAQISDTAAKWRPGLSVFAVHFACSAHVTYCTAQGPMTSAAGGLGTPNGLRRQVNAALEGRVKADDPWLLMVDSTAVDPGRAPGAVFKFLTIAPELRDGQPWSEEQTQEYAQGLLDFTRQYVEGLDDDNILAMRHESPTTISQHNRANIGGSCHDGEFLLEDRSVIPGWLDYRTDIEGLYLTGSTSHPGGSVSGRPGRNSAREVLKDLGVDSSTMMSRP